jgi:hypothetical protein
MTEDAMRGLRNRVIGIGLTAAIGVAVMGSTPSFAQFGEGPGATAAQHNMRNQIQANNKPESALPPVLPGTKGASEAAAPTGSPADLSPTDGLFDAINRGDLTAARDAVNRGANLDGQNLLGLTPLDLSVDLGRNDISFMLLSMRGDDAAARKDVRNGTDLTGGARRAAGQVVPVSSHATGRTRLVADASQPPEEPVVATPRLNSGNGGAPIPAAGFLGFDGRRPTQ